ncbi:Dam family site-specific DNA-(adenine-N6)-methyltransferase [bacterium]|nr:Dam family site-specific DNA-(adenine-N6)-methyltransferase [bacterium]
MPEDNLTKTPVVKPCLRWAGGKRWLISYIRTLIPKTGFNNYHEPFLGGAAVFLSINPKRKSYLSDLNKELIETYSSLRLHSEEVIDILKTYRNTEKFYYSLRSKVVIHPVEKAARFIYLNQTSYNGLYRVNLKGEYNVPYGFRTKEFLEPDKLRLVSRRLKKATLSYGDFSILKNHVDEGDLIFLDPPYTVSHNKNNFIKYNKKLFSLSDQERLSELIDYIKLRKAYYILTNAAHKKIHSIFDKGDNIVKLNRANLIGGVNAKRGQTSEYIFTNLG